MYRDTHNLARPGVRLFPRSERSGGKEGNWVRLPGKI